MKNHNLDLSKIQPFWIIFPLLFRDPIRRVFLLEIIVLAFDFSQIFKGIYDLVPDWQDEENLSFAFFNNNLRRKVQDKNFTFLREKKRKHKIL